MGALSRLKVFVQKKLGVLQLKSEHQTLIERQKHLIACEQEILKANLFRDTIFDCEWLKYKSFSPGGWAVDYGLLYTLFRVLNDMKPHNVIEFGLGQSSKMIHQYGSYFKETKVKTIEHDKSWVSFFESEVNGHYPLNIQLLDLDSCVYRGFDALAYKGLAEACVGETFDLIVVDGPFGTDHFSRYQLIDLVQNNLADSFCVIMDDYDRQGEKETIEEVKKVLEIKNIPYLCAVYESSKQHCLICSKDMRFLTTLYWF